MNRKQFLSELEFLLSDLPYSEVKEALEYYNNYFDEAGIENEENVIAELKSPACVASMIKEGYHHTFDDNIEYSDAGAENRYYKEQAEVVEAEVVEEAKKETKSRFKGNPERNQILMIGLIILGIMVFFPVIAGIGGGFAGLFAVLFVLAIICGFGWFAFFVGAVILIVQGLAHIVLFPGAGLIMSGVGILFAGLGFLCVLLSVSFFKLIPTIFNTIVEGLQKLFKKAGI